MLKFTAKFNTLDFSSFEKVCAVLQNNGWTFSEEPVFMFGLCIVTIQQECNHSDNGDFELSQIIDAIECTPDCTICSVNVIENTDVFWLQFVWRLIGRHPLSLTRTSFRMNLSKTPKLGKLSTLGVILKQVSGCIDLYHSIDTLSMEQH